MKKFNAVPVSPDQLVQMLVYEGFNLYSGAAEIAARSAESHQGLVVQGVYPAYGEIAGVEVLVSAFRDGVLHEGWEAIAGRDNRGKWAGVAFVEKLYREGC